MTVTKRPGREQRLSDILQAAFTAFSEYGYEQTAVSDIAASIGIVEGTIYKYFPSKRELLLKTIEHWYAELVGQYEQDIRGIAGPSNQLRFLIWRHLKTVVDHPRLCRLMFREVRSEQDYLHSDLHQLNKRYTGLLMTVIAQGAEQGVFKQGLSLTLIRDVVYGGMEHHAWNFICGRGSLDVDAVTEALIQLIKHGIAAVPAVPTSDGDRLKPVLERLEAQVNRLSAL